MSRFMIWTAAAVVLLAARADGAAAQAGTLPDSIDTVVARIMDEWRVPGVVVVVVRDGATLVNRGYGMRMAGESLPVGPQTLVHIASHSKAMTATALALLVDQGRLSWEDPVHRHVPEFAAANPVLTDQLTVRDLAAHRGGLPAPALGGFRNGDFGIEELLAALRTATVTPLRDRQVYSQAGIALAGEVIARISGMTWEAFVRERIFAPLGMDHSFTSTPDLVARFGDPSRDLDVMIPARTRSGDVVPGTWSVIGTHRLYAPAGGVTSTGTDLARWISFLLGGGELEGQRLLSAAALAETRTPLIPLDPELRLFTDPVGPLGAGTAGWNAVAYGQRTLYFAPGGWMSSVIALVPEANVGVGIFTNAYFSERHAFESLFPTYALAMSVIDVSLGETPKDWSAAYRAALDRAAPRPPQAQQPGRIHSAAHH
jgi:CubicO group peptidase (beta-lactamase class C family)